MLSKDDVTHLAELARLALSDEEKERLVKDLGGILEYVSEISGVVTTDTGPVPGDLRNVLRADEATEGGEYSKDILANAPATENGYIKVRRIL
jgi:aspartyl-tRNA(Asn)/glutamyl-tRNA(Gln) amidotransferase subunit C